MWLFFLFNLINRAKLVSYQCFLIPASSSKCRLEILQRRGLGDAGGIWLHWAFVWIGTCSGWAKVHTHVRSLELPSTLVCLMIGVLEFPLKECVCARISCAHEHAVMIIFGVYIIIRL